MPFKKSVVREYFETIVIAVVLALFFRTFVVQAFKIPTGSMETNLLIGDHLLVNKLVYSPSLAPLESRLLGKKQMEIEILEAARDVVKESPWLRKGSGR